MHVVIVGSGFAGSNLARISRVDLPRPKRALPKCWSLNRFRCKTRGSGPRSSIRCTVQLSAAIFRIITERRVFVVQGWRGGMAAGLEWSEPIGIMMAWRRSLVTITATGVATLNSGELVQMLVLGAGNARSGASTRAVPPSGVSGS